MLVVCSTVELTLLLYYYSCMRVTMTSRMLLLVVFRCIATRVHASRC